MTFNDYIEAVRTDAVEAVNQGDYDYCADVEEALDEMWCDDSITGNGSGSYTFNAQQAAKNTADLIWDDDFLEELEGMGIDLANILRDGPEALDVTARCLALAFVRDDVTEAWNARAC